MNQTKYLVAVDLGSNSFHLVIAREQAGCIKIVHSQKQRVSLVEGLNNANLLSQEAIDRGIECLKEFRQSFSHLSAFSVRVVATHALRSAVNSDVFLQAALKVFPYPIEIISGEIEAALIYQGVAYTQPIENTTLIIDIG
ncbi:MAG: exopolyphosphatase/guanosine-5'-triphosphate,3'-diphosphate pyrophosphatase, partial [Oceanospirillaceae bacterium]